MTDRIPILEEWLRIVNDSHSKSIDLAARRLVSATARRSDPTDRLIDAVTGWENLVGTSTEVTFRVTAALAKLLEPDPSRRREKRRRLGDVYGVRSSVVHGDSAKESEVRDAARDAVAVLIEAMRTSYRRGSAWLSLKSRERADILLLEEP